MARKFRIALRPDAQFRTRWLLALVFVLGFGPAEVRAQTPFDRETPIEIQRLPEPQRQAMRVDPAVANALAPAGQPPAPAPAIFLDLFDLIAFDNNDGTASFSGGWIDPWEFDGPDSGEIRVRDIPNGLGRGLRLRDPSNGAIRLVDLSTYSRAIFSFDYWRNGLSSSNDFVAVIVSADGVNFFEIDRIGGPDNDTELQSIGYDISALTPSTLWIGYFGASTFDTGRIFVDNVMVTAYQEADVALSGTASVTDPEVGDPVTFTISAENLTGIPAPGIEVASVLPTGLTYDSHTVEAGSFDPQTNTWNVGSIAADTKVALDVTAVAAPGTEGQTLGNVAYVQAADLPDPDTSNNSTVVNVTVQGADLSLAMTVDDAKPNVGDTLRFDIAIENKGPSPANGVSVNNAWPPGLQLATATPDRGPFDTLSGDWDVGTLAAGEIAALELYAEVQPGTAGTTLQPVSTVNALSPGDPSPPNNSQSVDVNVQAIDMVVTKNVSKNIVDEGDTILLTTQITNLGPDVATGLTILDKLPSGLQLVAVSRSEGVYLTGPGHWSIGSLPSGRSATLVLTTLIGSGTAGSTLQTTSSVFAVEQADLDSSNDMATEDIVVSSVDVAVGQSVDQNNPPPGSIITIQVQAGNAGPSNATGIVLETPLPTGLSLLLATPSIGGYNPNTGLWTIPGLAAGSGATLDLQATVDSGTGGQTLTKSASLVTVDQVDVDSANDTSSLDVQVVGADLRLAKASSEATPAEGDTVRFTVQLSNDGPNAPAGIVVTDSLPPGTSFVAASASQGSYNPSSGAWIVPALAVGANDSLMIDAIVGAGTAGSVITNTARIIGSSLADPDTVNNVATADIAVSGVDLIVGKSVDQLSPSVDDTVTFTVTVNNSSAIAPSSFTLSDSLPAGLDYVSHGLSAGSYDPGTGLWSVGSLSGGTLASLTILARVDASLAGNSVVNQASIVTAAPPDPNPTNSTASVQLQVQGVDLALAMAVSEVTPDVGDTITYAVTLSNAGPDGTSAVQVDDALPAGLVLRSHATSRGSYDPAAGTWTVGAVAAGQLDTLQLVAEVEQAAIGATLINTASLGPHAEFDTDTSNDTASVAISVPSANLGVTLQADDLTPTVGDTVSFNVDVSNLGPDDATSVELDVLLPTGLTLIGSSAQAGVYHEASGRWTVGDLSAAAATRLDITALIAAGSGGTQQTPTASIVAVDQGDPDSSDNSAAAVLDIQQADLGIALAVSSLTPIEGDSVVFRVTLTNAGPDTASSIAVAAALPTGTTFRGWLATEGTYDVPSGVWTTALLAPGVSDSVEITALVNAGTAGTDLPMTALIAQSVPFDDDSSNDSQTRVVDVQAVDLEMLHTVDNGTPNEGETILFTIDIVNNGPDLATGVAVDHKLPAELGFISGTPNQGTYDPVADIWMAGSIAAGDTASLDVHVFVLPGAAQQTVVHEANVIAVDQTDVVTGNESVSVAILASVEPRNEVSVTASQQSSSITPAGPLVEVLTLTLQNHNDEAKTCTALTLQNASTGAGTSPQLDSNWGTVRVEQKGSPNSYEATVSNGQLVYSGLDFTIPPLGSIELFLSANASLLARDGDALDLRLDSPSDVKLSPGASVTGSFPLNPAGSFLVDGLVAAQLALDAPAPTSLAAESNRTALLRISLPANGYTSDVWERINLVNLGDAQPGRDIAGLEAWIDDGDGNFDASDDTLLGPFTFTGGRWELTGFTEPVPQQGLNVFVTVDIASDPLGGTEIHLSLPTLPDVGIGMASGNSGPIDRPLDSPKIHAISETNRVTLTSEPVPPGTVLPGEADVLLLHLIADNTTTSSQTLSAATIRNTTTSPVSTDQNELDANFIQIELVDDTNDDGVLDSGDQVISIGSQTFGAGTVTFGGLSWVVPDNTVRHLFVRATVHPQTAADADVLSAELTATSDLIFESPVSVAGSFPIHSGTAWTVDGMLAAQIQNLGTPPATLGPNEGPALALRLTIPSNGYAADRLQNLFLENAGTAGASDISLNLWRAGPDGLFDPQSPTSDDVDLGPLVWLGSGWQSPFLDEPIPVGGLELCVGATVSGDPGDGSTIKLRLPADRLLVDSGNDGPIDGAVENVETLLISTAPLLASLEVSPSASVVGGNVTVRMTVRNVSNEQINGIRPTDPLQIQGTGAVSLGTGPAPPSLDLAPDESGGFVWSYTATAAGEITFAGNVQGTGSPSGLSRLSLSATSNTHAIFNEAGSIDLFPVLGPDIAVSRGQTDVIPLSLTLINDGGSQGSDVRVREIRIDLEDLASQGIVPSDVLARVVISEGSVVYADKPDLETSGSTVSVPLSPPVQVTTQEPVTLSIQLDISASTVVPVFRVVVPDESSFVAEDVNSGAAVVVAHFDSAYPVISGVISILGEAAQLDVDSVGPTQLTAGPGQAGVQVLTMRLDNPGIDGLTASVRVPSFRLGLRDGTGAPIADPSQFIDRIQVSSAVQNYLDRPLLPTDGASIRCDLSPQLLLPVNTPLDLNLVLDIAGSPQLGDFQVVLEDSSSFLAQDVNTLRPVPVIYGSDPLAGALVTVQGTAPNVGVGGTPAFPPKLGLGERDVAAFLVTVTHPGSPQTADLFLESLSIQARDESLNPLISSSYLDRVRILRAATEIANTTSFPSTIDPAPVSLGSTRIAPGETIVLEARVDLRGTSPLGFLQLGVEGADIECIDANTGQNIPVQALPAGDLPIRSGVALIENPSRELVVELESLIPAVIVPDGSPVTLGNLRLLNPSPQGFSAIRVDHLILRSESSPGTTVATGSTASRVMAFENEILVGVSADLGVDSTTAWIDFTPPLLIEPGQPVDLELRMDTQPQLDLPTVRFGVDGADVGVNQPTDILLAVQVEPAQGLIFPLWTESSSLGVMKLEESYANFPNPFAAGRSETTFTYFLDASAQVTLEVYSLTGDRVLRLLEQEPRAPGLHQSDIWDGRNSRGDIVRNGTYLARLLVRFDSGREEEHLHKVSVKR